MRVISLGAAAPELPSDRPQRGEHRLVRLVPTPLNAYVPCIWRSPNPTSEGGQRGRWCIVLMDKGGLAGSKPQTGAVFVPDFLWDKLPEDVVEW